MNPTLKKKWKKFWPRKQNNDFLEGKRSHFSDELFSILEFVPDGFAIDEDLEDDSDNSKDEEEDYSDLEKDLIEVSEKEEKLLPDSDLKWDEEEKEDTTPYEGGAPDEEN